MDYTFSKEVRQILATLCSLPIDFVNNALAVPEAHRYRGFLVPKKRGGTRQLHEPCEELKVVQGALLEKYLYPKCTLEQRFFGYVPGRSPAQNARYHIWYQGGKAFLPQSMFHVDLKDAFPSARVNRLVPMFTTMFPPKKFLRVANESMDRAIVFQQEFIDLLVYLTTYQGCLPQGAATSPYLLNMLLNHLNILKKIDRWFGRRPRFKVSIYADDITVSLPHDSMSWRFRQGIIKAIHRTGFRVNPEKTRYNELDRKAHRVTGVSLGLDPNGVPKLTLAQKTRDTLRGNLHRATLALESGREPNLWEDGITLSQAHGMVCWVEEVYKGFDIPSDVGVPLLDFNIAYAEFKSAKKRW